MKTLGGSKLRVRLPGVLLALMLGPVAAQAHLVTTGLGPVYDGIGHFMLSPDDWIPVIALALLAGLRGSKAGRYALFLLPLAWFMGGLLAGIARESSTFPFPAISFLVLGGLVAADLPVAASLVAVLAVMLGLVHGWVDAVAMQAVKGTTLALLGMSITIFVIVALVAAFVVSLKNWPPWTRIVVRVAGSWVAAIGLLLLGWSIHARNMEKIGNTPVTIPIQTVAQ